jgi:hypothetical protein
MSRPTLAALLLLWTAGPVLAQEGEPAPAPTQQDADAAYQDLARALNKAIADWRAEAMAAVKAAQAEGRSMPAIAMAPPTRPFIVRAHELAEQHAGTDAAVPFLGFIVKNASSESDAVRQALKTLWADHSATAAIAQVLDHVTSAYFQHEAQKEVTSLLDAVIEDNPEADVKAQAMLVRGNLRLQIAETDAQRAEAAADIRKVATLTKNEEILTQAKDALFEIEHLQVGCAAPDIAAKDTDGVEFKLSDYRGKVVLLDFWGFW